jgi:hypothetical protein
MRRGLQVLNGQALTSVQAEPHDGRSRFSFDLGCALTASPYQADDSDPLHELWTLYEPSEQVLAVRSDGCYCQVPAPNLAINISGTRLQFA